MMSGWTDFLFALLNSILCFGVLIWIIRSYVIPGVRYDFQSHKENISTSSEEIAQHVQELAQAEKVYRDQEREVARLTVCIQQWTDVLAQRSTLAEQEQSVLFLRYKERCNENERVRMKERAKHLVSEQVLKNTRAVLQAYYLLPGKQVRYMDALCHHMSREKSHD